MEGTAKTAPERRVTSLRTRGWGAHKLARRAVRAYPWTKLLPARTPRGARGAPRPTPTHTAPPKPPTCRRAVPPGGQERPDRGASGESPQRAHDSCGSRRPTHPNQNWIHHRAAPSIRDSDTQRAAQPALPAVGEGAQAPPSRNIPCKRCRNGPDAQPAGPPRSPWRSAEAGRKRGGAQRGRREPVSSERSGSRMRMDEIRGDAEGVAKDQPPGQESQHRLASLSTSASSPSHCPPWWTGAPEQTQPPRADGLVTKRNSSG